MALAVIQGQPRENFLGPKYKLVIGSSTLQSGADCSEIWFKDAVDQVSVMQFTLNNEVQQKDRKPVFKYTDGKDKIELGQHVELQLGYADAAKLESMIIGEVVAIDPQFVAGIAPTVRVRVADRTHRMRNRPRSETYEKKTDFEIAQIIAQRNGLKFKGDKTAPRFSVIAQDNVDDLAFLRMRARRIDYEVFVLKDELRFVKSREGQKADVKLELGVSLSAFLPSLSITAQVSKVTVRAWHPSEGRLIEKSAEKARLGSIAPSGKNAGQVLEDALGAGKEEILVNEPVLDDEDAQNLAEAILKRTSHRFVVGEGKTVGTPVLRAGTNIELAGLGARFGGTYYVTESTHRYDASGYQTTFCARKAYV